MKHLITISLLGLLFGCAATSQNETQQYPELSVTKDATELSVFSHLRKFPPRYPMNEASSGTEGCATIEYVVTEDREIEDIKVIDSTHENFADEAKKVIQNWNWMSLNRDALSAPIKTQTRFEYCLEDGSDNCSMRHLLAKTQCRGGDVVGSVGYKVK